MNAALFLTEAGGGRLLEADQGFEDDGVPVLARLETVPAGPGVGGEAIFTGLFLTVTGDAAGTVSVTPIISGQRPDGTPFDDELETQVIVCAAAAVRSSIPYHFGLTLPLIVGGAEVGRFAPRGTWFRTRVVLQQETAGDLIAEALGVEMEVVREAIPTSPPTPPSS
jgi:hypothetical protein